MSAHVRRARPEDLLNFMGSEMSKEQAFEQTSSFMRDLKADAASGNAKCQQTIKDWFPQLSTSEIFLL